MTRAAPAHTTIPNAVTLPEHRDAYYGGAWHKPQGGRYVDTLNPGTGESLGRVADCSAADIDAAVAAAKAAFKEWRRVPPLERARVLRRIAQIVRDNAGELAMIDAADCGNPVKEMIADANIAAAQIEFFAGLVTEMKGIVHSDGTRCRQFLGARAARRGRPHHPLQPPLHVLRRQDRRAAGGGQHGHHEAAGAGAAVFAAVRRTVRGAVPARRVQRRAGRTRGRARRSPPTPTSPWWR